MPFLTPTTEINDLSQRVANLTGLPTRWLSSFEREYGSQIGRFKYQLLKY